MTPIPHSDQPKNAESPERLLLPGPAYLLQTGEVTAALRTDDQQGLEEADAQKRLEVFGPNELDRTPTKGVLRLLLEQMASPLVWILLAAGGLGFLFAEWVEGTAIIIVVVINILIGFFMEWQAQSAMLSLQALAKTQVRVRRDGRSRQMDAALLVPGDLIELEAGDVVPADCRIVTATNLGVKESVLSGESTLVSKQSGVLTVAECPLAERRNLLFNGTSVGRGNTRAIVYATGEATELGRIAQLTREAEKSSTPLEKKLAVLSTKLLWITVAICLLMLLLGWWQGRDLYLMIKTATALAVAAIPEGLPIVATIALARGMLRLARRRVIVKRLSAVETLGETQVIFTDKTGTLTLNVLSVDQLLLPDSPILLCAGNQQPQIAAFQYLSKAAILCNNAVLNGSPDAHLGDPLEVALLEWGQRSGLSISGLQSDYPRKAEMPFDSETKMMATLHQHPDDGEPIIFCKGAVEVLLDRSSLLETPDGPQVLDDRSSWLQQADELARQGLRVLAFAYRRGGAVGTDFARELTFLGCLAFIDPPREDVRAAIDTCQLAGIKVIMLTGDHPATARQIAYRTGLTDSPDAPVISGRDLPAPDQWDDADLSKVLEADVYARVSPDHKLQLVRLYQEKGFTVGMTGDGVNDTPALKKADIGIAMGMRGTAAAREAADLILEDDAFTSIELAIRQGRGIFANIRYFVMYLLSCNLSEVFIVGASFLSSLPNPIMPLQILFLNMVTDVFPALALGLNPAAEDVMSYPPRRAGTPIVGRKHWTGIIVYAVVITLAVLACWGYALYYRGFEGQVANNLAFYTLNFAQLWHVLNLPSRRHSFFRNEVTRNPYVWWALLICLLITLGAYLNPTMREVLDLEWIPWSYFLIPLAFSALPIFIIQLLKRLRVVR